MNSNATAIWRAHRRGAYFANPCFTQIHPTCIPRTGDHQSKLTLMSESLRNDGRIWVPKAKGDDRPPNEIPEDERDYYLERIYPVLRQPRPPRHRLPRREERLRRGPGRRPRRPGRLPRLRRRHRADGPQGGRGEVRQPLRHVRADHRRGPVRGADADLPRRALHDGRPLGRLRPPDHRPRPVRDRRGQLLRPRRQPARRLRPDAGPRRRLLRAAVHHQRLPRPQPAPRARSTTNTPPCRRSSAETEDRLNLLLAVDGDRTPDSFHRELGELMWEFCGMARTETGCARRWSASRRSARSSGAASRCPAPARSSTSRWRRPTASSTTWSSPS